MLSLFPSEMSDLNEVSIPGWRENSEKCFQFRKKCVFLADYYLFKPVHLMKSNFDFSTILDVE